MTSLIHGPGPDILAPLFAIDPAYYIDGHDAACGSFAARNAGDAA